MSQVAESEVQVLSKTEQRISSVVTLLRDSAPSRLTYAEIALKTGSSYDYLIYIMQTLVEVRLVERTDEVGHGPGRPKCFFSWVGAQGSGP